MSIPGKVLIALLTAFVVAVVAPLIDPGYSLAGLFPPAAIAALLAVILSHRALPVPGALATDSETVTADKPASAREAAPAVGEAPPTGANAGKSARGGPAAGSPTKAPRERRSRDTAKAKAPRDAGGDREEGSVKWFNVTKGYGFIIRGNGEEIFVHHRSIVGEGRGRLDDGARVRFRVAETDKGPQAEDVESL